MSDFFDECQKAEIKDFICPACGSKLYERSSSFMDIMINCSGLFQTQSVILLSESQNLLVLLKMMRHKKKSQKIIITKIISSHNMD